MEDIQTARKEEVAKIKEEKNDLVSRLESQGQASDSSVHELESKVKSLESRL